MKIREVISSSWKILFNRYGITLLTLLAWLAIIIVLGLLSMVPIIGFIAMCVILIPILFGFIKQFVALYNGEDVKAFDFLNFGFKKFGMVWRVIGRLMLKCLVPNILMFIAIFLGFLFSFYTFFEPFIRNSFSFSYMFYLSVSLRGVSFVWYFILSLKYMFVYNELTHNENAKTGKEILEATAKNMKGNVGKLLLLDLILILMAVLVACIPVLGILLLLLIYVPFIHYVTVAFYEHVRKEKMPDYEVLENIDIDSGNGTEGPIQNI